MRLKRFFLFLLIFISYIFMYYLFSSERLSPIKGKDTEFFTRSEFVHLLCRVKKFELYLPEESNLVSSGEIYKAEISFLATKGISVFLNTDGKVNLTRGELAETLYSLVDVELKEISTAKKISFLAKKDIIEKGKINKPVTKKEIMEALNTSYLADMTAETYISPDSFSSSKVISNIGTYPNPVDVKRGNTTLTYKLDQNVPVSITIYDLMGYEIKHFEFKPGEQGGKKGTNEILWDCTDGWGQPVMKGGYICRIVVHSFKGKKVVIRKIGVIP